LASDYASDRDALLFFGGAFHSPALSPVSP